jgi:hypothetical protein
MSSRGDTRGNGMVFIGKHKGFKSGEYCIPMDRFLEKYGADFYEKKARARANKIAVKEASIRAKAKREWIEANKDALITAKKEKDKIKSKIWYQKNKHLNIEKRRAAAKASYERMKLDPIRLEKHKAKSQKASDKQAEKRRKFIEESRLKKKAESDEKKKAKAEEIAARREARAKLFVEKSLAKSLRPKRIVLTDEQRAEARRQEKRNYKHVRRARINSCEVRATPKMVEDARSLAGDCCYYCGKKAELTLDHFESLAKGGAHCVSNFVFCCHPCNSRKRDLDPFDFMESNLAVSF